MFSNLTWALSAGAQAVSDALLVEALRTYSLDLDTLVYCYLGALVAQTIYYEVSERDSLKQKPTPSPFANCRLPSPYALQLYLV